MNDVVIQMLDLNVVRLSMRLYVGPFKICSVITSSGYTPTPTKFYIWQFGVRMMYSCQFNEKKSKKRYFMHSLATGLAKMDRNVLL